MVPNGEAGSDGSPKPARLTVAKGLTVTARAADASYMGGMRKFLFSSSTLLGN
jgi:hypothetical protein